MQKISRQSFLQLNAAALASTMLNNYLPVFKKETGADSIRVGVIGCGKVSQYYIPHLLKTKKVEVVSLCDIIESKAASAAKEYGIEHHYANIDDMLDGTAFDLLVNLTDMQEHGHLNLKAIKAKRHVWSEKPVANSFREGRDLLDLALTNKVRLWSAPVVVNSPQFSFISKFIQEGKLGKISAAHAHYGHRGPNWSAFFYEKGGGSLPDLGVYSLSTLTGLLGPVRSVVAMTSIVTKERKTENKGVIKVEAEDNAMVLMEHRDGILSHVQSGFNYFDPHSYRSSDHLLPTVSIWGTEAKVNLVGYDWDPIGIDIVTVDNRKTERFMTDSKDYTWEQGASLVGDSLHSGNEPVVNIEHALHVLEIIEAVHQSQAQGIRVPLTSGFPYPLV